MIQLVRNITNIISTSGDVKFRVMIDYSLIKTKISNQVSEYDARKELYVGINIHHDPRVDHESAKLTFGYFGKDFTGKKNTVFISFDSDTVNVILNTLMKRLNNTKVLDREMGLLTGPDGVSYNIYIDKDLKIINIVRRNFDAIVKNIYLEETPSSTFTISGLTLTVSDVRQIRDSLDIMFGTEYSKCLNFIINKYFIKSDSLNTLKTLRKYSSFRMFLFKSNTRVFLNPLLDSYSLGKVFKESLLFDYATSVPKDFFSMPSNIDFFPVTTKEICKSLDFKHYMDLSELDVFEYIMGLYYPDNFLTGNTTIYYFEDLHKRSEIAINEEQANKHPYGISALNVAKGADHLIAKNFRNINKSLSDRLNLDLIEGYLKMKEGV